jgi:hypothetical protein
MASYTTTNYGFTYYDQYEISWHTGINNNFINLDSLLANIEADVKGIGGLNLLPHTLFQHDSNSDNIPDLWTVNEDGCTVTKTLLTSEVMGFAQKIQLDVSNSSGSAKNVEFKITAQVPPNLDLSFSAWVKSPDLAVYLRISDGVSYFDTASQTYASATRVEKDASIDAGAATVDLIVRIYVPDGTTNKIVEIHLPMLNVGDKAAAFVPCPGEMTALLVNNLHVFGTLQTNLDCNQLMLKNHRLHLLASDPGSPVSGQIWFDDASGKKRPRFYDGSNNLDLSVAKQTKNWYITGSLGTGTEQGGAWIVPQSLTIEKVYIYCKITGSAGSTIVDINKNGTTIFTTQANRPTLAYDDADKKAESGTPEVTDLAEGDVVSIDIDQIATGAADLSVIIICR